jgi:cytochrome c oxidase subunit IV
MSEHKIQRYLDADISYNGIQPPTYGLVFVALLALTGLTVWLATVDLGLWHVPVGLAIAAAKATVIALFFMHVLYSPRLTWAVVLSTLLFLGILILLTISDYLTRDWQTTGVLTGALEETPSGFAKQRRS